MCRPQSSGGRRCPLHSSSGFVGTRLARRSSGLDTRQVNAAFQVLRHEGERATDPTPEQWAEYLQTKAQEIESSGYGSRTMRAMRNHISEAAGEMPDGPTFYALNHLDDRARSQRESLNEVVNGLSETLGISRTAARRQFAQLRAEVDTSRGAAMPSGYSPRSFRAARDFGMPLDTPSLHALGTMTTAPAEESAQEQRRVTLQDVPGSVAVHSMGYDDGRLEIRFRNVEDDSPSRIYAYHNVPASLWERFQTNSAGFIYNHHVRGNPAYAYDSVDAEEEDAMARRCGECGQFAASRHTCPPRRNPLPSDQGSVDSWSEVDSPMNNWEDVILQHELDQEEGSISEEPSVSPERIESVQEAMARISAERDLRPDVPSSVVEVSEYSVSEYMEDLRSMEERGNEGAIPFMTENATNGLLTPESGMGFGVELEFDDGGDTDIRERIGRRLHEEGITSTPYQREYHAAAGDNWSGWSYEKDETVGGEIVSPILYDRPEDWETLRKVCDIIREEGGYASNATGGHVHVSSGMLGNSIAKHAELLNTVNENEDLIYRLGTKPGAERHRTLYWCAPNPDVDDSYERGHSLYPYHSDPEKSKFFHFRGRHASHSVGLNMQASGEGNKSHLEFRQFDGSLDAAVIQTQVKLSAAIVSHVANKEVDEGALATPRPRNQIGANVERLRNRQFSSDEEKHEAHSQDMRTFAGQMFTRREDRAQMTALFASTAWQSDIPDWDESSDSGYDDSDDYDYNDDSDDYREEDGYY